MTHPTITRPASQLTVGDRIAAGFLPDGEAAEVVFVQPYKLPREPWALVVCLLGDGYPEAHYFKAETPIPLKSVADTGLTYSREPESTVVTPVPAGVEGHAEGTRAGGEEPGLIVGDTADEQRDNAYAAYERDEAEYLPNCPECMGQHHTVEPCR